MSPGAKSSGRGNELANGVLGALNLEMPTLNLHSLCIVPQAPRQSVSVPSRGDSTGPGKSPSPVIKP